MRTDTTSAFAAPRSGPGAIKGAAFREFLNGYAEAVVDRERLVAVVEALPSEFRRSLDPSKAYLGTLPSSWYPATLVHALVDGISDGISVAERQLCSTWLAGDWARHELPGHLEHDDAVWASVRKRRPMSATAKPQSPQAETDLFWRFFLLAVVVGIVVRVRVRIVVRVRVRIVVRVGIVV